MEFLKTAKSILDFGIDAIDPSMELLNEDVPDINFHLAVPNFLAWIPRHLSVTLKIWMKATGTCN